MDGFFFVFVVSEMEWYKLLGVILNEVGESFKEGVVFVMLYVVEFGL